MPSKPVTVALIAIPETTTATLFGLHDILASVGRAWEIVVEGSEPDVKFESRIVSPSAERFEAANGVWVQPHGDLSSADAADLIVIPNLRIVPGDSFAQRYPSLIAWLRERGARGAVIASACNGAFLLAESGLIDGGTATTHWGFCDAFRKRFPRIEVKPNQILVPTGTGERIITSGGGSSWQDLALYLIGRFAGPEQAIRTAKIFLIDWHERGQLPFAAMTTARQTADAIIADCQTWLADHYASPSPVTAMVERSGLSERSFKRRFAKATGLSPIDYVHALRIEEAKQALEADGDSVEAIAASVGYEDAGFFRRLFRRRTGLSPAEYRRKFRRPRDERHARSTNSAAQPSLRQ
jgi:transcriptional regulator GlxA family with amidase domain